MAEAEDSTGDKQREKHEMENFDIFDEEAHPMMPVKKSSKIITDPSFKTPKKSPHKMSRKTPSKLSMPNLLENSPRKSQKTPMKTHMKTPSKKFMSKNTAVKRQRQDDVPVDEPKTKSQRCEGFNADEEGWEDVDEEETVDKNIDAVLDEKASKIPRIKMSAKNVKSVIHHVLTNEHVINMFQDALESKMEDLSGSALKSSTPRKLDLIPKMTRAKVKEFVGKLCMPSPVKIVQDSLSILDVEFNEEEDDDEYSPEKDEECHESDEESVVSSCLSELGSPFPATPSTPGVQSAADPLSSSFKLGLKDHPPSTSSGSASAKNLEMAFNKCAVSSTAESPAGVDTIARRTRSKLPLTSTSITDIESAFVAPDITADMYDNNCEDVEWVQFLSSLYKPSADDTITDDETDANDPEFNYMAEAEREKPDEEDFRFDKPTQITKKELNSLINELQELFEDEVLPYQVVASVPEDISLPPIESGIDETIATSSTAFADFKTPRVPHQEVQATSHNSKQLQNVEESITQSEKEMQRQQQEPQSSEMQQPSQWITSSTSSTPIADNDAVTSEQRALIEDNMRKHIQLLAQSHLMFQDTVMRMENLSSPKELLTELNHFRQLSPAGTNSVLNVCNLDPALEFVSDASLFEESGNTGVGSLKPDQLGAESKYTLTYKQKLAIYNSPTFVYPTMLPGGSKKAKERSRKSQKFLESEDNLMALGLEQFQYCKDVSAVQLIHKLLIRGKNQEQIFFRIQRMCSQKAGDNAIKHVKKTGKLPENFPKPSLDQFYPKAPKEQVSELLPTWCLLLKERLVKPSQKQRGSHGSATTSKKKTKRSTSTIPLTGVSTPATQTGQSYTVSSVSGTNQVLVPATSSATASSQLSTITSTHSFSQSSTPSIPVTCVPILPQGTPRPSTAQPVVLQKDLPITGIYIQFGTPGTSGMTVPQPVLSIGNSLPVMAPKPVTVMDSSKRGQKRKISPKAGASKPSGQFAEVTAESCGKSDTPIAHSQSKMPLSSDLLARTMKSCGIVESPQSCPPESPSPSNTVETLPSTTPIKPLAPSQRTKHPSVRNLNPAFDASLIDMSSAQSDDISNSHQNAEKQISSSIGPSVQGTPAPADQETHSEVFDNEDKSSLPCQSPPTVSSGGTESPILTVGELHGGATTHSNVMGWKESCSDVEPQVSVGKEHLSGVKQTDKKIPVGETQEEVLECGPQQSDVSPPAYSVSYEEHKIQPATNQIVVHDDGNKVDGKNNGASSDSHRQDHSVDSPFFPSNDSSLQSGTETQKTNACDNTASVGRSPSQFSSDNSSFGSAKFALDNPGYETPVKPKTVKEMLEANRRKAEQNKKALSAQQSANIKHSIDPADTINTEGKCTSAQKNVSYSETSITPSSVNEKSNSPVSDDPSTTDARNFMVASPVNALAVLAFPSPIRSLDSSTGQRSPLKTPTKVRPLAPKATPPSQTSTPGYVALPKISPKRKELNKQVRQILPKSFVFEVKSPSPTKAAAMVLKKKAAMIYQHRSPVKILPKQAQTSPGAVRPRPILTPTRMFTRSQRSKNKSPDKKGKGEEDTAQEKHKDTAESEVSEVEDACMSQEEDEDEESGNEDKSQLDDLMAACTTIGYEPKKGGNLEGDNKSKAQKKKDLCLSMLDQDILERDPKKDERDTAYAQHYFNQVKQVLQDDPMRFRKFLTILNDLNKNHCNPVELYTDMATLLSDHQDLVDDFAGFLLAFQAVECECFVSHLEYQQIRNFLRQLEIYCDTSTLTFQRTLKMMSKWLSLNQEAQTDTTPFKERIGAVLRHVPDLMDDLLSYFFDGPVPDSHPKDFEDVDLEEQDMHYVDEFEELTLPEGHEDYNTKSCSCQCHEDPQDEKLRRRIKHCFSCGLRMLDGTPVLKLTRNEYRPVTLVYPLEEKEKMMRAKKEAAQLALAKARAQRQQNKKKNKNKRDRGKLKSKGSKKLPLKKKLKQRKKDAPQNENCTNTNRPSERGGVKGTHNPESVNDLTSDDHIKVSKPVIVEQADEQMPNKANHVSVSEIWEDGEFVQASAERAWSGDQSEFDVMPAHIDKQIAKDVPAIDIQVSLQGETVCLSPTEAPGSHQPETETAITSVQQSPTSAPTLTSSPMKEPSCHLHTSSSKGVAQCMTITPVTQPIITMSASSLCSTVVTSSLPSRPYVAPPPDICPSSAAGSSVHGNQPIPAHSENAKTEQLTKKSLPTPVSHPMTSLTQLLSGPIQPLSASTSLVGLPSQVNKVSVSTSQAYSSSPAVASINAVTKSNILSSGTTSIHDTGKSIISTTKSSQKPGHVNGGIAHRFASPLQGVAARIPVIVNLTPQQFLPTFTSAIKEQSQNSNSEPTSMSKSGSKQPPRSHVHASQGKYNTHVISEAKESNENSDQTEKANSTIECDTPEILSSNPSLDGTLHKESTSPGLLSTDIRNDDTVSNVKTFSFDPEGGISPAQIATSNVSVIPTSSSSSAQHGPSVSHDVILQASGTKVTKGSTDPSFISPLKVAPTSQPFFSPGKSLKERLPELLRTHLENFSLSGFDDSMGIHNIQQLAQSISPSKLPGDSMSKFDLLAYIESSNLTCKDSGFQAKTSIPPPKTTPGSLLSFSGAIPKSTSSMSDQGALEASSEAPNQAHDVTPEARSTVVQVPLASTSIPVSETTAISVDTWTEEMDRCILNVVTDEGVTNSTLKKLQLCLPNKSIEELSSRAVQLLDMLQDIGDTTESDTGTDTSLDGF